MQNITVEDVQTMSPEEVKELQKYLAKKLLKRFALVAGIGVASVVAINLIGKHLDDSEDIPLEIAE